MVYIETCYYHRAMRPEMPEVLEAIQNMGYKIGLISNVCSRSQVPDEFEQNMASSIISIPSSSRANTAGANPTRQFFIMPPAWRMSPPANASTWAIASPGISWGRARQAFGLAIQIRNDFKHGEVDEGATPDASDRADDRAARYPEGTSDGLDREPASKPSQNPASPGTVVRCRGYPLLSAGTRQQVYRISSGIGTCHR